MRSCSVGALLCALLVCCTSAAAAYRCERHGHVTYTDQRCESHEGNDRRIERDIVSSAPPAKPSRAAQAADRGKENVASDRERAEVARLQALREQRERQDERIRDLAARGAAARERKCKALQLQLKWREEDLREAPLDKAGKARTRLRRAAEKYQTECR